MKGRHYRRHGIASLRGNYRGSLGFWPDLRGRQGGVTTVTVKLQSWSDVGADCREIYGIQRTAGRSQTGRFESGFISSSVLGHGIGLQF